ncbi:MAG: AAA family ATPase [Spirochaetales bacterium]|nr:AAA family ATPase [Spirochaetales bacterium]
MERLIEQFRRKMALTQGASIRSIDKSIAWEARLIGIRGARGVGKTTLLLQHIKNTFADDLQSVLYVSLDNLWFSEHRLIDLADEFHKKGGEWLFLDEVHKYPEWARTLKNLYDDYPDLHIVFTGSSLLEILDARADLSRRALMYELQGLSFREYLNFETGSSFAPISLPDLLERHESIAPDIVANIKPFKYFSAYLQTGYYPYYLEGRETYYRRLEETIMMILELELPLLRRIDISYVPKLKQLLSIIAESAPFIPNISKLSERMLIHRQTLLSYLQYLGESKLTHSLFRNTQGIKALQKPDKLYLDNTNLAYLFRGDRADIGTLRETFLLNQLAKDHGVTYTQAGDFLVDDSTTIEVGGKNKTGRQIKDSAEGFIAADNLEYGFGRKVPLWLFGFLY